MKKNEWITIIILIIVISAAVAWITGSITGNAIWGLGSKTPSTSVTYEGVFDKLSKCMVYGANLEAGRSASGELVDVNNDGYLSGNEICSKYSKKCLLSSVTPKDFTGIIYIDCNSNEKIEPRINNSFTELLVHCCSP